MKDNAKTRRFRDLGCAPAPWTAEANALGESERRNTYAEMQVAGGRLRIAVPRRERRTGGAE